MDDGPLRLDAVLAVLGDLDARGLVERRGHWPVEHHPLTDGGWRRVEWVDRERGMRHERVFADEDALCRYEMVAALRHRPRLWPRGGRDDVPAPEVIRAGPRAAGPVGAPRLAWWCEVRPGTHHARPPGVQVHDDLVVLVDTAAVWRHGTAGALLLTALDAGTGERRWSAPLTPVRDGHWLRGPGLLARWDGADLEARDPRTGRVRWTRPWPDRPSPVALTGATLALAHGTGEGRRHVGLDLATGATTWEAPAPPAVTLPSYGDLPPRLVRAAADPAGGRLLLTSTSVDDGTVTTLAAPDLAGADPGRTWVRADRLDTAGLALVEHVADGGSAPGRAGLVRVGDPEVEWLTGPSELRPTLVDDHHVLWHARSGTAATGSALVGLDGSVRWHLPGHHDLAGRSGGPGRAVTVLQEHRAVVERGRSRQQPDGVVVLADDGTVRWRAEHGTGSVVGEQVWLVRDGVLEGLDLATGAARWALGPDDVLTRPWSRAEAELAGVQHGRSRAWSRQDGERVAVHG